MNRRDWNMNYGPLSHSVFVGKRVALARKATGVTQDDLAGRLGFKDRQILSNVESGTRKLSAGELAAVAEALGRPMEFFTDPYTLVEDENVFAWRVKETEELDLPSCTKKGCDLISAYMRFADLLGRPCNPILPQLVVDRCPTYEYVGELGESLAEHWGMGETPSAALTGVVQDKLDVELLYIDCPDEVAGASFRNDRFCAILVNRRHCRGRQSFSIAHEVFHVLTWTTLKPEHISPVQAPEARARTEKLANCFAASLLMPSEVVSRMWKERPAGASLATWLDTAASGLGVSSEALFWRLVTLRRLSRNDRPDGLSAPLEHEGELPRLFSKTFAQLVHDVIDQRLVELRKVLEVTMLKREGLGAFLRSYSLGVPWGEGCATE
jgi:Zn-dependent peptidase ImmA (M78 family)/transcriptional regulator with XRE-family HTH domain